MSFSFNLSGHVEGQTDEAAAAEEASILKEVANFAASIKRRHACLTEARWTGSHTDSRELFSQPLDVPLSELSETPPAEE